MLKMTRVDPTLGAITPSMLKYAIPIFLNSLIQTLMNATDAAVLGNMADSVAVASVGATSTIVALLVASMISIAGGSNIILARAYGARNYDRCKTIMNTALAVAVGLGALIAVVGSTVARPILTAMNCPSDCIDGSTTYLVIYLFSAPLTLLYNFGAGIISVSGDSAKPMKYMIISGVSNVILNIILCLVLTNKVVAVAAATVVGTGISAVLVLRDLLHHDKFPLEPRRLSFSPREALLIFKYGIPMAFNSALYSLSNVLIQSAINSYGSSAIAGNTSAIYIENIPSGVNGAFGSATIMFVGQNLGANKPERVKKSIFICTLSCFIVSATVAITLFALGKPCLSIFVPEDETAISFGLMRMKHLLPLYGLAAINGCLASAISAFGFTSIPTLNSVISVLLLRIVWMRFIYPQSPTPDMLYLCYSISWILSFLIAISAFLVIYARFKKGKIKKL